MSHDATNNILIGTSLADSPVPKMTAALARRLVDSGYRVTLLAHGPSNDSNYVHPKVGVLKWPSPRPSGIADAVFLDRLLRQLRPCCVISHFGASLLMMSLGAFRKVPVRIRWYHTLSTQIGGDRTERFRLGQRLRRLRGWFVYKLATHVVANSHAAKQDVVRTFQVPPSKCQVFWNALQDPLANPGFVAKAKAAVSDPRRFICVGRFDPSKGQDIALKAMAKAVRRLPALSLDLVGDGPTRKSCENLARELGIADRCNFTGALAHENVLLRLASARATIAPSRAEAFGLVNIESMALGVPVIGSNTGGIAEILHDGADGLLFPPGDHEELASRITQIAENETLRNQVGEACRRRFLAHFELSQAVKAQADWIAAVIRSSV